MNKLFFTEAQLEYLISNQLLQSLKRGPGAGPINPVPFQLQQLNQDLSPKFLDFPKNF